MDEISWPRPAQHLSRAGLRSRRLQDLFRSNDLAEPRIAGLTTVELAAAASRTKSDRIEDLRCHVLGVQLGAGAGHAAEAGMGPAVRCMPSRIAACCLEMAASWPFFSPIARPAWKWCWPKSDLLSIARRYATLVEDRTFSPDALLRRHRDERRKTTYDTWYWISPDGYAPVGEASGALDASHPAAPALYRTADSAAGRVCWKRHRAGMKLTCAVRERHPVVHQRRGEPHCVTLVAEEFLHSFEGAYEAFQVDYGASAGTLCRGRELVQECWLRAAAAADPCAL